jgi:hypothetical protein
MVASHVTCITWQGLTDGADFIDGLANDIDDAT